jgi:hypothetical protein
MVMTVFYVSLGPFSRYVIEQIKGKLAEFDAAGQSLSMTVRDAAE